MFSVIGAGDFGLAVASIINEDLKVYLYSRDKLVAEEIQENRSSKKHLKDLKLTRNIVSTNNIKVCLKQKVVFLSIPTQSLTSFFKEHKSLINDQTFVFLSKGIDSETGKFIGSIVKDLLSKNLYAKSIFISGPSFANELAKGEITGLAAFSEQKDQVNLLKKYLKSNVNMYYYNNLHSLELGGALKNIYAMMSGLLTGLKVGANTKALFYSLALLEMQRFKEEVFSLKDTEDFFYPHVLGDFILTCTSVNSRNFRFGENFVTNQKVDEVLKIVGGTVEGLNSLKILHKKVDKISNYPLLHFLEKLFIFQNVSLYEILSVLKTNKLD